MTGGAHGWAPPRDEFYLRSFQALAPWAAEVRRQAAGRGRVDVLQHKWLTVPHACRPPDHMPSAACCRA